MFETNETYPPASPPSSPAMLIEHAKALAAFLHNHTLTPTTSEHIYDLAIVLQTNNRPQHVTTSLSPLLDLQIIVLTNAIAACLLRFQQLTNLA